MLDAIFRKNEKDLSPFKCIKCCAKRKLKKCENCVDNEFWLSIKKRVGLPKELVFYIIKTYLSTPKLLINQCQKAFTQILSWQAVYGTLNRRALYPFNRRALRVEVLTAFRVLARWLLRHFGVGILIQRDALSKVDCQYCEWYIDWTMEFAAAFTFHEVFQQKSLVLRVEKTVRYPLISRHYQIRTTTRSRHYQACATNYSENKIRIFNFQDCKVLHISTAGSAAFFEYEGTEMVEVKPEPVT